MNVDIFPTVLGLVGASAPQPALRGQDLFDDDREDDYQFAEYYSAKAIKYGRHKLILWTIQDPRSSSPDYRWELFDVVQDPNESKDLFKTSPELASRLSQHLSSLDTPSVEDKLLDRLRALGYLEQPESEPEDAPNP